VFKNIKTSIGKYTLFKLEGDMEQSETQRDLLQFLKDIAGNASHKFIVMNLDGIDYLNSQLLGGFLYVDRQISKNKGKFCLFGLSSKLMELVRLINLDAIIPIFPDEQAFRKKVKVL